MMSISSPAGRRLAKALAGLQAAGRAFNVSREDWPGDGPAAKALEEAQDEFRYASIAVADELMAHGFHDMDGED